MDSNGQDALDAVAGFGPAPESSSRVRPGGEDDIDGRGSFEARDLEMELRRMRRGELQVNFGIQTIYVQSGPAKVSPYFVELF